MQQELISRAEAARADQSAHPRRRKMLLRQLTAERQGRSLSRANGSELQTQEAPSSWQRPPSHQHKKISSNRGCSRQSAPSTSATLLLQPIHAGLRGKQPVQA